MALWTSAGQALTGSAPTAETDGFDLRKIKVGGQVRLFVKADGGNCTNLTILGWIWDNALRAWARCPAWDFAATAVGQPYAVFHTPLIGVPQGRAAFTSSGSTVSAGTTLTFTAEGQ